MLPVTFPNAFQTHVQGICEASNRSSVAACLTPACPHVHDAVMGAVGEVGKRLSDRLATKQELQTLSYKVPQGG